MLFLKFYWFIMNSKWERTDSDTFFNKEKGFTLRICSRSSTHETIEIRTGEDSKMIYGGIGGWFIRKYFKNIDKRIEKQRRKKEKITEKEQNKIKKVQGRKILLDALNRQCYVEIEFDDDRKLEYEITEWLDEKKYSFEKHSARYRIGIYYFQNKDHATEFKMVWG